MEEYFAVDSNHLLGFSRAPQSPYVRFWNEGENVGEFNFENGKLYEPSDKYFENMGFNKRGSRR